MGGMPHYQLLGGFEEDTRGVSIFSFWAVLSLGFYVDAVGIYSPNKALPMLEFLLLYYTEQVLSNCYLESMYEREPSIVTCYLDFF